MSYLIGSVVFIVTLGSLLLAFDALMPKSYFDWMQNHRWGREAIGMLMLAMSMALGLVAFWLAR